MTLIRFNPMRQLVEVEREFNRLFKDFEHKFGFGYDKEYNEELDNAVWAPLTDVYEDSENFKLKLDLPGIQKEDVKISYADGRINITGERKQEKDTENFKYHRVERSYGKFFRSFELPKDIDEEKISADFSNGQLTIAIPKSEKAKPKEIPVNIS